MSEVALSIGGRRYTVACAQGEEAHVQTLGESIDAKLRQLGNLGPQESQNLLFASLLLADDLFEAKKSLSSSLELHASLIAERDKALSDARIAEGQCDGLRATIAELEAELGGLQTSQQQATIAMTALQDEMAALKSASEASAASEDSLKKQVTALRNERDTLERRINELVDNPPQTPQSAGVASLADDPDLAPALERFAELLENCADKLEAGAATS